MSSTHQLERSTFDALARGQGGPAAIDVLRSAQLSKHLLLIGNLLQAWPGPAAERDAIGAALDQARAREPAAVGDVLGAPLVGAWTAIATRALRRGVATPADFGHLGVLAAVAGAAAGVDVMAAAPVREATVAVPGLGTAVLAGADGPATISAVDGRLEVRRGRMRVPVSPGDDGPQWRAVRRLSGVDAARTYTLCLDDLDPYRHGHHAPPAPRLSPAEFERWQRLFGEAWSLLVEHLPVRAAEIAVGLRTLVPLVQSDERSARSATIRDAFGVFGLTRPPSAAEFAVTLVHEFQHSKLSAILDVTRLTDPADRHRYFAPWRVDARPLSGLLQGVYAFVGVSDTWRALRTVDSLAAQAEAKFAQARLQVDRGLSSVERSGALTVDGAAFAAGLRAVTDAMLTEPVPPAVIATAQQELEHTRQQWVTRNGDLAGADRA